MSLPIRLTDEHGGAASDESLLHCPYCKGTKIEILGVEKSDLDLRVKVICLSCHTLDRSLRIASRHGKTRLCWTT